MEIVQPSKRIPAVPYFERVFEQLDSPGSSYGFNCDEDGTLHEIKYEAGRENLRKCLSGEHNVIDKGVVKYWHRGYVEPAVGLCDCCGRRVTLDGFTNTCECGADYNWNGALLAPRHFWGEETGEHWTECI